MDRSSFAVDYRAFRLSKINRPEYRHLWYLLFWPGFVAQYFLVENLNPAPQYHMIHCVLDDWIPFQEVFLLFYVAWYVMIAGMHLYTMLYDVEAFRNYSRLLILSMSICTVVFLVYPSCQELRPESFPRNNLLTRIVGFLYWIDTPTNILPSEHAVGAIAVFAAAAHTRGLRAPARLVPIGILAVLVSVSTVFLKQHSALDVLAALPVCAVSYWIVYHNVTIHGSKT